METKKRSFLRGGEFLVRETGSKDVFIPEEFGEQQQMMAEATSEFIEKEVEPERERFEKKDYEFTLGIMKKAGEQGLLAISVPEEYDGLGMDFNTSMLVCDRISGISGSLSTAYGAHTGIGTLPILLYGDEKQRKKYLPKLASGEWMGAYCLTEPGAGSDANSGKTKAVLSKDKKHYLVTGQKIWISNAGFADVFIVFARIEDDKYLTGFIVDRETEGISFGEEEHKMGIHSSSTRQVFFNDCKVPAENLLGERNGGFKIAMNALNYGRIKLSAATLDGNRRLITRSTQYANERKQFGKSIGEFGAVQQKLAEMSARHWAVESATYRAAQDIEDHIGRLGEEKDAADAKLQGVEEYAVECAMLKVASSEIASYVADEGVQIFGGMGFSADYPMEAAYRDVRITRIYEGTNEINRMHSVGMLMKKALKGEIDLLTPAKKVAGELMEIPDLDGSGTSEPFAQEKEMIAKMKKAFLMTAGKAVETFGADLEDEQEILMNAADMMIATYLAESAVLRAEKLAGSKGEKEAEYPALLAKLYLHRAVKIVGEAGREAIYSFASGDEQRMMLMGIKRFTKWAEPYNPTQLRRQIAAKLLEDNKYCFS